MWILYCVTCLLVIYAAICYSEALHTYTNTTICKADILFKRVWGVDFYGAKINFYRHSTGSDTKPFFCNASISAFDFMSSPILLTLVSDISGSNVKVCLEPLADNNCVKNRNDVMRGKSSNSADLVITGDTNSDISFELIFNTFTYSLHGYCVRSDFKCKTDRCIDKSLECVPPYSFCGDGTPPCFSRTTRKPYSRVTEPIYTNIDADNKKEKEDSQLNLNVFVTIVLPITLVIVFVTIFLCLKCNTSSTTSDRANAENLPVNTNVGSIPNIELADNRPEPSAPIAPTDYTDEPGRENTIDTNDLPPSYEDVIRNENTYKVVVQDN